MGPVTLFSVKTEFNTFVDLKLNEDGTLGLASPSAAASSSVHPIHFGKSKIIKGRWTHVALVYYPHRSMNPNIRTPSIAFTYCHAQTDLAHRSVRRWNAMRHISISIPQTGINRCSRMVCIGRRFRLCATQLVHIFRPSIIHTSRQVSTQSRTYAPQELTISPIKQRTN
jgi:hypothetical protein